MARGATFNVLPGGPCLRCLYPQPPAPGSLPIAGTHGVIGSLPAVIAGVQAAEALKLLSGSADKLRRTLLAVDLWANTFDEVLVAREPGCICGR
jgi:adenylyltransferase/sulfurtransferase